MPGWLSYLTSPPSASFIFVIVASCLLKQFHNITQVGLELTTWQTHCVASCPGILHPPASTSLVLALQVCTTTPGFYLELPVASPCFSFLVVFLEAAEGEVLEGAWLGLRRYLELLLNHKIFTYLKSKSLCYCGWPA